MTDGAVGKSITTVSQNIDHALICHQSTTIQAEVKIIRLCKEVMLQKLDMRPVPHHLYHSLVFLFICGTQQLTAF